MNETDAVSLFAERLIYLAARKKVLIENKKKRSRNALRKLFADFFIKLSILEQKTGAIIMNHPSDSRISNEQIMNNHAVVIFIVIVNKPRSICLLREDSPLSPKESLSPRYIKTPRDFHSTKTSFITRVNA